MSTAATGSSGADDLRRNVLEPRHVDRRHADHDRLADHLRQRGGGVAGADVRDFAQRVQLDGLQRTEVFHEHPQRRLLTSTMSDGRAVAEQRGAAEERQAVPNGVVLLDDDLLLPDQLVDHERRRAGRRGRSRPRAPDRRVALAYCGSPTSCAQPKERQHLVAHQQHFACPSPCARCPDASSTVSLTCVERDRVRLVADARQQRAHDGQRERQPQRHRRSLPRRRADVHRAAERAHARVAPRRRRRRGPRDPSPCSAVEKPAARDEPEQLVFGELRLASRRPARRAARASAPARGRCRARRRVTRIATAERSRTALSVRRPAAGFPARRALVGRLDAVIDRVAQQVHDRIADLVEHRAIELDLLAFDRRTPPACRASAPRRARARGKRSNTCHTGTMRLAMISSADR